MEMLGLELQTRSAAPRGREAATPLRETEMRVVICLADNLYVSVVVAAAAAASADGDGVGQHDVDGRPLHGRVHSGRKSI